MAHRDKNGARPPRRTTAERTTENTAAHPRTGDMSGESSREDASRDRFFAARRVRNGLDVLTIETAKALQRVRKDHVAAGHHSCTREALAEAYDVDDKQLFQYEDASKRAPLALLASSQVSADFREDLAEEVLALGRDVHTDKRALVALGNAVSRIVAYSQDGVLGEEQREALAAALRRFAHQLTRCAEGLEEP